MKKIKLVFGAVVLSTVLGGNAFAGGFTGYGVFSIFSDVANAIVSMLRAADPCEGRICTNCKPVSEGGNGNCRPTENNL